jgi:hypothetical protein
MLTEVKTPFDHTQISDVAFVAAVAASIARRCQKLSLPIEELRESVKTQILSTETILQYQFMSYEDEARRRRYHQKNKNWRSMKTMP